MSDPRVALRAAYGRWLRIRADVRGLAQSLAAAEYELQRNARRSSDEPEMATLVGRLHAERGAIDELAKQLDARIANVRSQCDAIEANYVKGLIATARLTAACKTAACDETQCAE